MGGARTGQGDTGRCPRIRGGVPEGLGAGARKPAVYEVPRLIPARDWAGCGGIRAGKSCEWLERRGVFSARPGPLTRGPRVGFVPQPPIYSVRSCGSLYLPRGGALARLVVSKEI